MSKTKFFVKYLKNINILINSLLEKNLNKLNFKNYSYLLKNNKIVLTIVALGVVFISYLLLPTFYKQSEISKELKTQLQGKFDINLKFSESIKYNFFPRPHFTITNSILIYEQDELSKVKKLKIFVSINNLLSLKKTKIKDVIFENANFNLNKKNYNFFSQLLNKNFKNGNLIIKNSNIFFKSTDDEVLFINKILKMKYYFESRDLKNIFYSNNELFNIPYSIKSFYNDDKSKIFSKINFTSMKFNLQNELSLNNEIKIGKTELISNKFKRKIEYKLEKKIFDFHIFDKEDEPNINYVGKLNFKPFYATLEGDVDEINFNYLFGPNAVLVQLLKTEIFNSKNVDFKLNINAKKISDNSNFRSIKLNSKIQDGLIDTDKTKFAWKNVVDFELLESLIFVKNGELVLDGRLKINIKDYNEVYKYLLTPKNYRNKIAQIDLNFTYNFDQKIAELKDIKIDNKINDNVNKILNNVVLKKHDLQNKIYFKNLLNEAIKNYAG